MLKDSGYKVDVHIMPDLPSSSPEKDLLMFFYLLSSSDLQADQWKVYPCEVTPFSEIEKWYAEGRFVPYAEKEGGRELVNLLLRVKAAVHPWIRLNRVVRDIPNQSIIAGNDVTNLRRRTLCLAAGCDFVQPGALQRAAEARTGLPLHPVPRSEGQGHRCPVRAYTNRSRCIQGAVLKAREYESNGGQEIFLSFETADEATILGFLRLRLCSSVQRSKKDMPFSCLAGAALLRELHVYGSLVAHGESKTDCDVRPQHAGLGRRLIQAAEILAMSRGFFRMAVIAGVGTREYYRKHGYELRDTYMLKELTPPPPPFVNASLLGLPLPEKIQIKKVSLLSAGKLLLAPLPPPLTTRKKQPRQTSRKKRHSQPGRAASGCEGESKVQSELKPDGNGEGRRPFTRSAGEVPIEPASHYNGGCWAGRVGLVECDTSRQDWLKSRRTEWQDAGDVQLVDVAEALGRARDVLLQNRDSDRRTVDATQYPISDNYEDPDSFAKFSELYPDILSQVEEVCEASVEVSCQGPALETCQAATAVGGLKNHSHVVEKLQTSWRAWKQSCLNCLVGVKQLRFSTATWVSVGFAIMVGCSLAVLRVRRR
ncbi:elongator complex protein elp3 [Cystoisospora suis]|uniref:Elongator complex protein elp3 n=1 Tax=Cystoisospora suis TaxID=483139 RepID=A0A2C6LFE1_9APIC|nr:elongator complex protein elp3 [Cystoisospora suis]